MDSFANLLGRRETTRQCSDERGVALVEFAFVLPILLLVVLGIVDFGRAFHHWIDQTHLANMGARWAAVNKNPGSGGQTLQQYIATQAASPELQSGITVAICFPDGTANVGDPVRVVVRSGFQFLKFLTDYAGLEPVTLEGSATMRIEVARTDAVYSGDGPCP